MDEHESWQPHIPAFVTMSRTWIEGGLPFQLRDPDFGRSAVYGGFSRVKGTTAVRTERALHGTGKGAKLILYPVTISEDPDKELMYLMFPLLVYSAYSKVYSQFAGVGKCPILGILDITL